MAGPLRQRSQKATGDKKARRSPLTGSGVLLKIECCSLSAELDSRNLIVIDFHFGRQPLSRVVESNGMELRQPSCRG